MCRQRTSLKLNIAAEPYAYKEHFRNQFKAALLRNRIAIQVVREVTLLNVGCRGESRGERSEEILQSQIAWKTSTTAFYKTGRLALEGSGIRKGIAYIGLVFKRVTASTNGRSSACGAQKFIVSRMCPRPFDAFEYFLLI